MILNYENAISAHLLNELQERRKPSAMPILHFGVGGFHRAHQAWALQRLQNNCEKAYQDWGICGVCMLPGDLPFVEALRAQDGLYYVQSFSPDGQHENTLVSVIKQLLHPSNDYAAILDRIASKETKVISFTITEGGYNVDNNHRFIWTIPTIQNDLKKTGTPQTVFRILAEGLRKRMEMNAPGVIFMSCDNVQHNGDVLKFALLEFLRKFDEALIPWMEQKVSFVKTMVDRITPLTTKEQKAEFTATYEIEDQCLVVCEDFFQWIIQKNPWLEGLPYTQMGATLVEDIAPYEKMKLRLLNGGHSLTGLLGDILEYDRIHTSINDPLISSVYKRYCKEEVIDTLDDIKDISYEDYVEQLISRFSNPMINDSTARIVSGSTDKLPKFVLPVILDQLAGKKKRIKWGILIIATWYCYLDREFKRDRMANVVDLNRDELLKQFSAAGFGPDDFLDSLVILAGIKGIAVVRQLFTHYARKLSQDDIGQRRLFIQQLLGREG